jgi:hypothetical protein
VKTAPSLLLISVFGGACAIPAGSQTSPSPTAPSFVAPAEPVPNECREEAHIFAGSLVRYPRPGSWHWVLICDEAGWRRFLRLSGRDEAAAIYASTDLTRRTTYIRGAKLLYPSDLNPGSDDVIAHELAHIRLQTESESRADDLVRVWRERAKAGLR